MIEWSETRLPEVKLIKPRRFGDARGYFLEAWNQQHYQQAGIEGPFVQDNLSFSRHGILRGLHFQHPYAQGKLVQVLQGEVFDVAVDIRRQSPRFGQWVGVVLSADNQHQLYIPPGFAHGFCVTGESALFLYKCTEFYHPEAEYSLRWNDPDIGIEWPCCQPQLSAKDQQGVGLYDFNPDQLPA